MTVVGATDGALERAIATRVRAYRVAAGASVAEMAARVGLSRAMLSESGTPGTPAA